MSSAFTSRRLTALGLAVAALGLASAAQADNKNLPTASDGTMPSAIVTSTESGGAFAGQTKRGVRLDAEAEFPASRLTAAEQAVFAATFKPKIAPYASAAEALDPESVIDSDRRFRVYPQESGYPYRAVGLLTFNQGSGSFSCTAWLISNNTVATAGHCVHSGGSTGVWSTNVVFYPARNGGVSPYGSCTATRLHSVTGWTTSANPEYDYGAARLNCTIGNSTGWLGRAWTTASQVGLPIGLFGYPGDKLSGTQWGGNSKVALSEARKTRYPIDTAGGQSGAPVVQADGTGPGTCQGDCGIAIHAYAASGGNNSGTRITQAVNNNLQTWINQP